MDYLQYLPASVKADQVLAVHKERKRWVNQNKKGFLRYRNPYQELSGFRAGRVDCSQQAVLIGQADEISPQKQQFIKEQLKKFMPWRKGPFSVFGTYIDAEWRSDWKWQRVMPHLPDLKGKIIADLGCSNGYYMFRMTTLEPKFILGLEPSVQHYYCFKALNKMAGFKHLQIDLLGVEHISYFPECFDIIFLMGIIYHRSSPIEVLRDTCRALRPGGTLIIESQGIYGEEPVALFPAKTYAKVPGTYFVPTGKCLENWLARAGFTEIKHLDSTPMSSSEQRQTDWMNFESYADFINPDNPGLTIEGYPAPIRILLSGKKK
ncbi:MAG: tRNA 5-methoxyuridine(34)/uridine 5-oxyacetic acid(34) synthase CmoB [Deltaproteobacteria bacterium]|nr:MAG: tRNA 5-methoxyuridine(34)/uridine 5-oxyacetic acid(34) synthase CmoB [Deltaproteobacteria bacterium]